MNIDDCKNHEASDMAKTKRQQILSPNHHLEHNVEIETGCIWTCNHDVTARKMSLWKMTLKFNYHFATYWSTDEGNHYNTMNNCQPFAPALTWTAEQYVFFTSTYSE
jgi:hypothetical protein